MELKTYQELSTKFRNDKQDKKSEIANYALGLVCEAGEVGDIIKKVIFHEHDLEKEKDEIIKELGDTLWYLVNLSSLLDIDISYVAEKNIEKLNKRYPNGFSKQDSRNRKE